MKHLVNYQREVDQGKITATANFEKLSFGTLAFLLTFVVSPSSNDQEINCCDCKKKNYQPHTGDYNDQLLLIQSACSLLRPGRDHHSCSVGFLCRGGLRFCGRDGYWRRKTCNDQFK